MKGLKEEKLKKFNRIYGKIIPLTIIVIFIFILHALFLSFESTGFLEDIYFLLTSFFLAGLISGFVNIGTLGKEEIEHRINFFGILLETTGTNLIFCGLSVILLFDMMAFHYSDLILSFGVNFFIIEIIVLFIPLCYFLYYIIRMSSYARFLENRRRHKY